MNGKYLRNLCLCTLFSLLAISMLIFVSCKSESGTDTADTPPTESGETNQLSSKDGSIQLHPLGIESFDEYNGKKAAEGNKIFIIYFEAVNKSQALGYLHRDYLTYRYEDNEIEMEFYPDGYTSPNGFIASGKRIKCCLAFEEKDNWKCLTTEYYPNWDTEEASQKVMDFYRADIGNGISEGSTDYPIDETDYSYILDGYIEGMKKKAFADMKDSDKAFELLDGMTEASDGFGWTDIDYTDEYPSAHLERLRSICQYLGEDGIKDLSDENKAKFNSAIGKWLNGKYKLTKYYETNQYGEAVEKTVLENWWSNDIGTPQYWTHILLMAGDTVSWENADGIAAQHPHSIFLRDDINYRGTQTGANLYDELTNSLYYYAYKEDIGAAVACFERFYESIYIIDSDDIHRDGSGGILSETDGSDDGGIAPDGSFWQHYIAYGATYGASNNDNVSQMLSLIHSIGLEPNYDKLEILSYYITESYKLTSYGNMGYMFKGASIGPAERSYMDSCLVNVASALLLFDNTPMRNELEAIIAEKNGKTGQKASVKYFDDCLISAYKTENVLMLARGARSNTGTTEIAENQNCLARNTVYGGQTEFTADGSEYVGLQGLWDWALVPGTTSYYESDEELKNWELDKEKSWLNVFLTESDYCNGRNDESTSTVYLKMVNEEGLTAYKSYFSHDGITVCLGADITDTSGNSKTVNTSVEQTRYTDARVNGESIYSMGTVEITDGSAVKNGSFAYYCLDGSRMYASAEHRSGNHNRVYTQRDVEIEDELLTVWFSHGVNPQDESYAYAVVDNGDGSAPEKADGLGITVLENSNDIQAVEFADGTAVAVFHDTSKSLTLTDGRTISAESEENRVVIVH